jgi:uncharacterized membrane protein YbhN (UPF0104 family)
MAACSTLSPCPPKQASTAATTAGPGAVGPGRRRRSLRVWAGRLFRAFVAAGVVAFAVLDGRSLTAAAAALVHLQVGWLGLALGTEATSLASFALLQRALLLSTGTPRGRGRVVAVTLAGAAIGKFLPGGAATEGVWAYRQLRRRGVARAPAIWVLLSAGALSYFALFVVVVVGVELAGGRGPMAPLRGVAAGLAALPLAAGVIGAVLCRFPSLRGKAERLGPWHRARARGYSGGSSSVARLWAAVRSGQPGAWGWSRAFAWALANWALDAAVFVVSLKALRVDVPWRGVVVAYGLGQVAGTLPLTPGGLGTVEASLTGLLVAYGTRAPEALAAVVAYRAVGFWVVAVVGASSWLHLRRTPRDLLSGSRSRLSRPPLHDGPSSGPRQGRRSGRPGHYCSASKGRETSALPAPITSARASETVTFPPVLALGDLIAEV